MRRLFLIALRRPVPLGCGGSSDSDKSAPPGRRAGEHSGGRRQPDQSKTDGPKPKDDARTSEDKVEVRGRRDADHRHGTPSPARRPVHVLRRGFGHEAGVHRQGRPGLPSVHAPRQLSSGHQSGDAQATVRLYRKVADQRDRLYRSFTALAKAHRRRGAPRAVRAEFREDRHAREPDRGRRREQRSGEGPGSDRVLDRRHAAEQQDRRRVRLSRLPRLASAGRRCFKPRWWESGPRRAVPSLRP